MGIFRCRHEQEIRHAREDLQFMLGQSAIIAQRANRQSMTNLWDAEVSVFSQFGEDGILDTLCDLLAIPRPRVVEFGAAEFVECNSRYLAESRSASVLAVDAREELRTSILLRDVRWRTTVIPRVEWITPATAPVALEFARERFGGVDIVSLDIDGNDYWVAESLDLAGVSIVVVEYNAAFGPCRAVSVPRNDQFDRTAAHFSWLYYGASLRAFVDLLSRRGFTFFGTNRASNNAFFVRRIPQGLPFSLPGDDLSTYTDVRIREGRMPSGELELESPTVILGRSPDLELVDVTTGQSTTVGNILRPES